jgi:hypothetical protein
MRKNCRIVLTLFLSTLLTITSLAQKNFFTDAGENKTTHTTGQRVIVPEKYRTSSVDVAGLKNFLWSLPSENTLSRSRSEAPVISLPMPDGTIGHFRLWESSVQEPALQAKFPEIRTFLGQGIDDPAATIRCDFNPYFGFSAQILSPNGRIYIDPYAKWDVNNYISYYHRDNKRKTNFRCDVTDAPIDEMTAARVQAGPCQGTQLRTYRLAVACTAEYANAVGAGNAGATHAAIVNSVNRVTGVYELELAVRLTLVANNNLIEYIANPDPYNNLITSAQLDTNQKYTDIMIGPGNYDIGHLFTSNDNGLAQLNAVCGSGKARGATGSPVLVGDGFDIDYVAHEIGHEFGGQHTFNSNTCASPGGSIEPGGGTTIMAYAGICAASENIQPNSDPIFHALSFDQISNFITTGGGSLCGTFTPTGNTLPVIAPLPNNNLSIPINTPFTLTASATDADGDALTYNWEGWDVGTAGSWTSAANSTTRPLFRTRVSKTSGSRTFPDIRVIAANYPLTAAPSAMDGLRGEVLPAVARTMKFRLTVRDNRAGGGGVVSSGDGCQGAAIFQVNAVGTTPFTVTTPNGGESYPGGSTQTIVWNVAGTDAAPISVANVKISISTDGGLTYPTVLSNSTANDGSESVTMPGVLTTTARIKVEALGNIFFDISNANFSITAPVSGYEFTTPNAVSVACAGPATASVTLGTVTSGSFSTPIVLTANNPNVTFSPNPLTPGNSTTVTLNNVNTLSNGTYTVTVTGTAGATIRTRDVSFVVSTGAGPVISQQPQAQTVCVNTNATFSVTAPAALSYQWQLSTGGGPFNNIAGATSSSFTVTSATLAQSGNQYRVVITGQCNTTTSDPATLTINAAPAIGTPPQSATLCVNSPATFSVVATGGGLTYQWQSGNGTTFTDIGGATSSSYTIPSISTAMNGVQYRVIVTGTCAPPATSAAATLTVISPVVVTDDPDNVTICETGNVSFTVAGTSTVAINYQWQVSTDGGTNYTTITNGGVYSGATTPTLTVTGVTAAMNNNRYRARLSNNTCTTPVPSAAAILTVNARPTVTLTSTTNSLLPGQNTTLTAAIVPSATGFAITWYKNNVVIPGVTGTTYVVDSVEVGDYKVTIVNQTTGCNNESNVLSIGTTASQRLFIFPNPNNGQFTVSYYNSAGTSSQQIITVHDARGALIYNAKVPVNGFYTLHNVNLRGVANGVYIVSIGDANGKRLKKESVLIMQ